MIGCLAKSKPTFRSTIAIAACQPSARKTWVTVALIYYLLWSRHHSALNDGGDGVIATAAAGIEDVEVINPPRDVP